MTTVTIEHVKVGDLPEAWRSKLDSSQDARVTVRIDEEVTDDPMFGMWRDREDMADVEGYLQKLRAPRC